MACLEPIGDQLSSTLGGNPDVQPEEADIYTLGIVYNPNFVEGLSLTLDYWNIALTNAITGLGEQLILDSCAATGQHCDKITRYTSGVLAGNSKDIDNRTTNVGGIDSSGYDFNIKYTTEIELGALSFNLDSTYYDTYDITQADESVVKNAGFYLRNSGDGNFPRVKSNFDARLTRDDWAVSYSIRYISSVKEPFSEIVDGGSRDISASVVHDARFTYFMDGMSASFGVNNMFDRDPPYADTGFNDNTDPRTYNTQGRHLYVSLGLTF